MDIKELLAGRAIVSYQEEITNDEHIVYQLVSEIFKASKILLEFSSILPIGGDENYDSYELRGSDISYILKISLEEDCLELLNEANFHKKNLSSICIPKYIDSGVLDIGDKITFLLLKKEEAVSLFDMPDDYTINKNFIHCLILFSSCEEERTFDDFFKESLKKHSLDNSDYLKSIINPERLKEFEFLFSIIRDSALNHYDKKLFEKGGTCHGNLDKKSVITKDGFFKFNNCNSCFKGSNIIDLCFLFLNLSFEEKDVDSFLELCSSELNVNRDELSKDFLITMPVVVHLKCLQLLYKIIIEDKIFLNEREDNCIEITSVFINVFYWCEKLNILKEIVKPLESIIFEISTSEDDYTSEIPDSINEPHKQNEKIETPSGVIGKLTTPKNFSLSYKKDGELGSILLSWDNTEVDNEYCIFFQRPNLEVSYYYTKNKSEYKISDIDFIGNCLIGVKSISKSGYEDSEYNKSTFTIYPS